MRAWYPLPRNANRHTRGIHRFLTEGDGLRIWAGEIATA